MRVLLPIILAAALVASAPAHADEPPPLEGGVTCTQKLKKRYRLGAVKRSGLPIKISCDGPATFFALPDFAAMTRASQDLSDAHPNRTPNIARGEPTSMDAAGTVTFRPRFTREAVTIMRRYRRTKLIVGLATLRTDGSFWSEPQDWSPTVVVR